MVNLLQKSLSTKRTFSYQKREVSLNFELKEDLQFLKDFRNLLIEARKDIEQVINEVEK